jgi:hypothetical protein
MARYYFHVEDGVCSHDDHGTDLADLEAAKTEGLRIMGEVVRDDLADFWRKNRLSVLITDRDGRALYRLDLTGAPSPDP